MAADHDEPLADDLADARPASDAPAFAPGAALALFALAALLLVVLSALVPAAGIAGVVLAQLVAIGGVPLAAARLRFGDRAGAALGLRWPSPRALLGGLLVGVSFWFPNLLLATWSADLTGGHEELGELAALVSDVPIPYLLLALAAVPALCEELLLRGVVARSLHPALGAPLAIVISAALFALLHGSYARLVPTASFGALLAYAALASGSVVPGILAHALNNAIALLLALEAWPGLLALTQEWPSATLFASVCTCLFGAALLRPAPQVGK